MGIILDLMSIVGLIFQMVQPLSKVGNSGPFDPDEHSYGWTIADQTSILAGVSKPSHTRIPA